jgi:hypothetical protein
MRFQKINRSQGGRLGRPASPRSSRTGPCTPHAVRRMWSSGIAVGLGMVLVHLALAGVSGAAHEDVERGYTYVAQARLQTESAARERLLTMAIVAFKAAYQAEPAVPPIQVQALLGAAQAYLIVQSPRRVFPFLWQATPLQRAEKDLQQALVLQPDNAAATLLLGIVYWRQAAKAPEQRDVRERSTYYLTQAAALGLPIALAPPPERHASPVTLFSVEDTIMTLRYIDARGVGRMEDLVFVYRSAASDRIFGVVVTGQQASGATASAQGRQALPLTTDPTMGVLAPHGLLESVTTLPQPNQQPILVLRLRQDTQVQDLRFSWDGTRFVPLPTLSSR